MQISLIPSLSHTHTYSTFHHPRTPLSSSRIQPATLSRKYLRVKKQQKRDYGVLPQTHLNDAK